MKIGLRRPSLRKTIAAYRSQWKRVLLRLFIPGYGMKGAGWLSDPKRSNYNFWYHRNTFNIEQLLGFKPSRGHCWFAATAAFFIDVFWLPVDATKAAVQSGKIRKEYKKRSTRSNTPRSSSHKSTTPRNTENRAQHSNQTPRTTSSGNIHPVAPHTSVSKDVLPKTETAEPKRKEPVKSSTTVKLTKPLPSSTATENKTKETFKPRTYSFDVDVAIAESVQVEAKPNENAPRSNPKNAKDQHIPKRMIIVGSSFCDKTVLDKLEIGSYIDLVAEPDNEYDKNAVALFYGGAKIGYIAKQDNFSYAICFKLGRKVYGVITGIDTSAYPTKYEYETWYDMA